MYTTRETSAWVNQRTNKHKDSQVTHNQILWTVMISFVLAKRLTAVYENLNTILLTQKFLHNLNSNKLESLFI